MTYHYHLHIAERLAGLDKLRDRKVTVRRLVDADREAELERRDATRSVGVKSCADTCLGPPPVGTLAR